MSLFVRGAVALFALVNIWVGVAVLVAGISAALEGTPDRISGAALHLAGMA